MNDGLVVDAGVGVSAGAGAVVGVGVGVVVGVGGVACPRLHADDRWLYPSTCGCVVGGGSSY
jgi:hypothetical protein